MPELEGDWRFWAKVEFEPMTGCFLWVGGWDNHRPPYGYIQRQGKTWRVSRYVWERLRGQIPHGLQIDHKCRNTVCVNINHLRLATPRENTLAGDTLAALNAKRTHCIRGHIFDPLNTLRCGNRRKRNCRICVNAWQREYKRRRRRENAWMPF